MGEKNWERREGIRSHTSMRRGGGKEERTTTKWSQRGVVGTEVRNRRGGA